MAKQAIIEEFQSWLADNAFVPDKERVQALGAKFDELTEAEQEAQRAAYVEETGSDNGFEYHRSPEDIRFRELLDIYHDKRKAFEKDRAEEQEQNFKEKKALIAELHELIQDEENIGKAYKRFNAIKQKWNEIGSVKPDQRRDLQADYSRLIELFYYNINIYRELQINDLKKNQELKTEVIEKIKALQDEKSINQVDFLIHQYLEEWDHIGPTFKEEWEKIRDQFKESVNAVFERIREHRKHVREDHDKHFAMKKALVDKVAAIAAMELKEVHQVQKLTKEVIETQKEWKHIGYAGRGKNDLVWKEFREACDAYFENRSKFLELNGRELKDVKDRKRSLIDKAKEIYEGADLDAVANQLKALQREWKQAGKLLPQDEYKYFKEFRSYCDAFFDRKKKEAKEWEESMRENLQKKEELLVSFTEDLEERLKDKGEDLIQEWRERWSSIGEVHDRMAGKVEKTFDGLIKRAYKSLGVTMEKLADKEFDSKLDHLSTQSNPESELMAERQQVQAKLKEAERALVGLEEKTSFFTSGSGNNPVIAELLGRVEAARAEVEGWKEKRKRLDLMLKELRQQNASSGEAS